MAVTKTGTTYSATFTVAGNATITSITIPADCEISIAIMGKGHETPADPTVLSWDGSSAIQTGWIEAEGVGTPYCSIHGYYMLEGHANHPDADTSGNTLTFNPGTHNAGTGSMVLFFLTGIDTGDPLGATDVDDETTSGETTGFTADLTGISAGDLAIIAGSHYYQDISGGAGQTNVYDRAGSVLRTRVDYEDGEDSPSITWPNDDYWTGIAFAINASSGGSSVKKDGVDVTSGSNIDGQTGGSIDGVSL